MTHPRIKQISWAGVMAQVVFMMSLLVGLDAWLGKGKGATPALIVYLVYTACSRMILSKDHRRGIQLVRTGKYDEAIVKFRDSETFFRARPWLDKYRAIILMSPSALSYLEMALVNIAFCHAAAGRKEEAKASYERALKEFPQSGLAILGLQRLQNVDA